MKERKKNEETGKRAEVIKSKTLARTRFATYDELVVRIQRMADESYSMRRMQEDLGIGRDAIERIIKDYSVVYNPDRREIIRNGVKDKYGVENVMHVDRVKELHQEGISSAFGERGSEIASKGWETRRKQRFD